MIDGSPRFKLAITMGDPAGIGPEIVLKALQHPEVYETVHPVVFGDVGVMRRVAELIGFDVDIVQTKSYYSKLEPGPSRIKVWQSTSVDLNGCNPGKLSGEAGTAAAETVVYVANALLMHVADAMVTAPINKAALALGGFNYAGHTELLAEITGAKEYGMLLLAGKLRVIHVSTHIALAEAIARVKRDRVLECIRLGGDACVHLGIRRPRIAAAGLNPHAGEGGLFGREDSDEIAPAVRAAQRMGIQASGPHPPDTVFARALAGEFDLVVAMYHDQGHIPVKLFGIDNGVNVSVGMPIIRVSVDHGTAFDIAGKGTARENSMLEAIRVAALMVKARRAARNPIVHKESSHAS